MNWDAVGAIAEVLALIGVIASLVYVGAQIRESSKQSRISSYNWSQGSFSEWTLGIATDEESSQIFHEGMRDFDSLKALDQTRFRLIMGNYFGIFDNIYIQRQLGVFMDEPGYNRHMDMIGRVFAMPGVQKWYFEANGRHTLHPSFATYLEHQVQERRNT